VWWFGAVRRRVTTAAPLLGAVVLGILALQSQAAWSWQLSLTRDLRDHAEAPLRWLDDHATERVARLGVTQTGALWHQVEFFNRRVTRVYAPPGGLQDRLSDYGGVCTWKIRTDGTIDFERACGPAPTQLYFDDPIARVTLHAQRVLAEHRVLGRVVDGGDRPRVMSLVTKPCIEGALKPVADQARVLRDLRLCVGKMRALFWLDRPATLIVRFRGSILDHAAEIAPGRVASIPAGTTTTLRWRIARGHSSLEVPVDWDTTDGPRMVGAELVGGGRRIQLLY
jgi:hypothetical protein